MKDKLNNRQQLFCQYLLQGKSQTQAYILAGYSPINADGNAARLIVKDSVKQQLATLQQSIIEGNILTVSKRKEILSQIAQEKTKTPVTAREKTLAIAELNKMGGDYAPIKNAVLGDIVIEVVHRDKKALPERMD